ncbi:uncharacterized protein LOC127810365 isoform X2 [Diospyros lotus]|uniref:uncharacterized protein LOC127810365 isoform X2 n=1 Tax=Diospyros lotus TaxID=55363 RepID=UPI0022549004|nr:uncharacterized protein LOC127810365 isoform X2 [Diospyros lotus]
MGDSSANSYIHMVQHLIEKCLTFHMGKEDCMESLSKHASIDPVITSTGFTNGANHLITRWRSSSMWFRITGIWRQVFRDKIRHPRCY